MVSSTAHQIAGLRSLIRVSSSLHYWSFQLLILNYGYLILLWKLYVHLKILLTIKIYSSFPPAFILSSCLTFQSTFDEKERIYLFWWKHFTVNKSPKAWYSCSADGSCCSSSMPLQIRSQYVFYHSLKVTREQPEAKNKKAK